MFRLAGGKSESTFSFLVAGLGNPGREYRANRHNVGFMVVDTLAVQHNFKVGKVQSRSITGSVVIAGQKVLVAKPQTFMNLSGQAVSSLLRYYKLSLEQLLVIHDDLDLPFGTLRLRPGGGPGGQKGLASIIEQVGTQNFPRLRIGIGRPPGQMDAAAYVLQNFRGDDLEELPFVLRKATEAVEMFVAEGIEAAMNAYNGPQIVP